MLQSTKNFSVNEFACKCGCGENKINQKVIDMVQKIRDKLGSPIKINSGYRCLKHNAEVGGVKNSKHVLGLAADLACNEGAFTLYALICDMKARGELSEMDYAILYTKKNFVHVDCGGARSKYFEVR